MHSERGRKWFSAGLTALAIAMTAPSARPAGSGRVGAAAGCSGARGAAAAARRRRRPQTPALGDGPWDFATEQARIHVTVVTKQLERPWGLAFLPNGDMLVTERPGRLRIVRNGALDPTPIAGMPTIRAVVIGGLADVVLHPDFDRNRLIYFSYSKPDARIRRCRRWPSRAPASTAARRSRTSRTSSSQRIGTTPRWRARTGVAAVKGRPTRASARAWHSAATACSTSRAAIATGARRRKSRPRIWARSFESAMTAECRATIRSSAKTGTFPRSTRSAIAIRRASRFILRRAKCGRRSSGRAAATS